MCSKADFHCTPQAVFQGSVHHIGQQVIEHTLLVNFIQHQYVFPLSNWISQAVHSNPTPKIQCIAGRAHFLYLLTERCY